MKTSWNDIKTRAAGFVAEIQDTADARAITQEQLRTGFMAMLGTLAGVGLGLYGGWQADHVLWLLLLVLLFGVLGLWLGSMALRFLRVGLGLALLVGLIMGLNEGFLWLKHT